VKIFARKNSPGPLAERNYPLNRPVCFEYANLSKFRPRSRVIDSTLLRVFASPIGLDAWRFETLPAASEWSNFNDRSALLRGISWVCHDAANEILEVVADKLSAAGWMSD
jgi:hypothetical protein